MSKNLTNDFSNYPSKEEKLEINQIFIKFEILSDERRDGLLKFNRKILLFNRALLLDFLRIKRI